MIAEPAAAIGRRAERLAVELAAIDGVTAAVADGVSFAGGGTLPMEEIPTRVVRLEAKSLSVEQLAAALRTASPPVIGRIAKDAVNLDLRTVQPGQTNRLAAIIRDALQ
jgi:L-seryl-tRNA(Ser) seleniumtransferase